ncbi:MAG: SMC family ATPase [Candidatus Micrarchaeia archaeon]
MIESIYLKNWRSHKETFISFSKGTNLLIGRMGGGKTSVVDGICFSLFGTCPSLKQRKISIQDLIRNRPKEEDEAEVILKIKFNGESYEIKRTIRRNGKSHAEIRKNNHLIVSSPEQVTKYIEDLLEVDYDLFTRAIYTEQNRIDYFLNLPKGERKKEIDNLLGLSKFEKVRENVRKLVRRLMDRLEDREILLKSMDANKLIEEIKSFKSEKEKIEISLKELKEKREIVSKQFEEKKEKYNSEKKKKEKYDLLNTNLLAVENSIKILEKEVKEVSIEELKKMLYKENEGLKKLKEKMDKLKDETNKIIEEKNRIEKKVYEIEVKIEEAKEIEDNLNKIKEEISKGNINELEKEYEKILKEKEKVIEE